VPSGSLLTALQVFVFRRVGLIEVSDVQRPRLERPEFDALLVRSALCGGGPGRQDGGAGDADTDRLEQRAATNRIPERRRSLLADGSCRTPTRRLTRE